MRGRIVDYLESKNKSPLMKKSRLVHSLSYPKIIDKKMGGIEDTGVSFENISLIY